MSRDHGHIVIAVIFFLFIGMIGLAEVIIEQEVKSHLDKKLNKKQHQALVLSQVKNLSQYDMTTLKNKALNRSLKWEERSACVDLLKLTAVRAQKVL